MVSDIANHRASGDQGLEMKMKTKIVLNQDGSVTVSRDNKFTGERYERTYFTGRSDGSSYVFFTKPDGNTSQLCERMGSTGITLMTTRENLLKTIRSELKKQNYDERGQ